MFGIVDPNRFSQKLNEMGFSIPLIPGESLLPAASHGKAANVNAEGWTEVHRDQPMETAYRQVIWEWKMKRGYSFDTESKLVDVPYKRYPRTQHPPFALELRVTPKVDGSIVLTLPQLVLSNTNELVVRTALNLLVEIFGECSVLTTGLDELIQAQVRHLNWRLLPPGKQPWPKLKEQIDEVLKKEPEGNQQVIVERLKLINERSPQFVAIGTHGFAGYLVFGFPSRHVNILESIYIGNATYGLGDDWEKLSKLSKAELLDQNLHKFRVIHSAKWEKEIKKWI